MQTFTNVKQLLKTLLFILFPMFCFAQQTSLSGKVHDSNGDAIPGAVIVLFPSQQNTVTDSSGQYELNVSPGKYKILIKALGFSDFSDSINVQENYHDNLNFILRSANREINPIVISAGKFEQKLDEVLVSMSVLKPSLIENTNQTTMETAVEKVPGVTVIDGQANIRGGSGFSYGAGSRVLVLVDDLPLLAGDANDVKWSFLPIENIEQVEILKGASSALFGSSALNGVINLRTAYPKEKPETIVTLYSGVYDTPDRAEAKWWDKKWQSVSGVNFSHRQKYKQLDLVLGGHYFNDLGYREGETEQRYRGNVNLRYRFKKITGLSAGIAANVQQAKGGVFLLWENDSTGILKPLGGVDTTGSTLSEYTTTRVSVDPYITFTGKKSSHRLRTRYFLTDNKNNTSQEAKSEFYYAEYLYQYHLNDLLVWSAGISASNTKVSGDLYETQKADNIAAYTQADFHYKRLNLSAGYRVEEGSISSEKLKAQHLFRAAAGYRFFKATYLRASYGQGFRFPSIAEKYIRTSVGNIVVYPNDSIKSERGWSTEIALRQAFGLKKWKGYIDVSFFRTQYRDMMEFTFGAWGTPSDPFFGLGFKSTNIGNTRITGSEISLGAEGRIGKVTQLFAAGFTYLNPHQLDFNPAYDTVVNSANYNVLKYRYRRMWKIDTETTYGKFSFGIGARYYSFMENIDKIFEVVIPGVQDYRAEHNNGDWVFDSNLNCQVNKYLKLGFIVKNVFNREYTSRPADVQPVRSYTLQAAVKF